MKLSKRILACAVTAAMATSMLSACNGSSTTSGSADSGNASGNTSSTANSSTSGTDNNSTDNSSASNNGGSVVEAPSNGTTLKWLGYYDLNTDDKEIVDKFADEGYTVEYISTSSAEYFTKLAQLVASSDSPDMVRYEWQSYPHGVANNLYTSLDDYVDFDSDTWSGMKDMIENFNYGGKHYYLPYRVNPGVVLIYNQTALDDEGIKTDPLELYKEGKWTWTAWKDIMTEWCNIGDKYYGVMPTGFVAMPFIVSTGTTLIDVDGPNKQIINNMKDANVQRCQDFLADLAKQGMVNAEYADPSTCLSDTKTLFAEFGLDWGWTSAQAAAFRSPEMIRQTHIT